MQEKPEQSHKQIPLRTDPASGQFIVADILPPRSQDIRLAASKTSRVSIRHTAVPVKKEQEQHVARTVDAWFHKMHTASLPLAKSSFKKKYHILVWILVPTLLVGGGYAISLAMSSLEIAITLKQQAHDVDRKISIVVDPTRKEMLAGERVELTDSGTEKFRASGTADVRSKAKGVITVYNAFNTSSQTLVANTRFESSDGLIYRTRELIIVPPAVMENGILSPRSIDGIVYADKPGPEYNRESANFVIPGFKGSPRYKGFYARSKTSLEGGHIGMATIVTREDLDTARESLEARTRSRLFDALKQSVLEGFVLIDDAVEITADTRSFSHDVGDVTDEFSGTIALRGRALVFKQADFIGRLTQDAGLDSSLVSLQNPEEITFLIERRNIENGIMILHAKGMALFVWNLDSDKLASEVASSENVDMLSNLFQQYPAIDRAEPRFLPSWIHTIPHNPDKIKIIITVR